ncbi:unnamed protein product [Trichobilharzia szidati]|nr:unnamed protein product [Trichobilharzia szidati]
MEHTKCVSTGQSNILHVHVFGTHRVTQERRKVKSKVIMEREDRDKRNRKSMVTTDERKSSGSGSLYMKSIRPVQMNPDKFPGYYVFQESAFGNTILPGIPRIETNK